MLSLPSFISVSVFTSDNHCRPYQQICMERSVRFEQLVLELQHFQSSPLFKSKYDIHDACHWAGVVCQQNEFSAAIVRDIKWTGTTALCNGRYQRMVADSLLWFPNSVHTLHLGSQMISGGLQTRMLPRELRVCYLSACQPINAVQLADLPERLLHLSVTACGVSGTINLKELPPLMVSIKFEQDPIEFVNIEGLPASLREAVIFSTRCVRCQSIAARGRVDPRVQIIDTRDTPMHAH